MPPRVVGEAAFCGFPHTYEGEDTWPDDARAAIDAEAQKGADAFDDAKELAYQQGRAGQVMTELQPPVDATGLTARWKALRAEWEKGQADAAADSKPSPSAEEGAAQDDTDDAETDALAGWTAKLLELNSWADIKAALHAFRQAGDGGWLISAGLIWGFEHKSIHAHVLRIFSTYCTMNPSKWKHLFVYVVKIDVQKSRSLGNALDPRSFDGDGALQCAAAVRLIAASRLFAHLVFMIARGAWALPKPSRGFTPAPRQGLRP